MYARESALSRKVEGDVGNNHAKNKSQTTFKVIFSYLFISNTDEAFQKLHTNSDISLGTPGCSMD